VRLWSGCIFHWGLVGTDRAVVACRSTVVLLRVCKLRACVNYSGHKRMLGRGTLVWIAYFKIQQQNRLRQANFMKHSHFVKSDGSPASQIPCGLWNPRVCYRVH
jgi:hypothetical protein